MIRKIKYGNGTFLIILLILISVLQARYAFAFGIAPGSKDIIFEPGAEHKLQLKIINNAHEDLKILVYAEGEFEKQISIEQSIVTISKEEDSKIIDYTLKLPENLEEQGVHTTNIVARQIPQEGAQISASLAFISKINVIVPYSGKYVRAKLFVSNFKNNVESNFVVEAENLGTEDVISAKVIIDIYTPLNEKIDTLISDEKRIDKKTKEVFTIKWTPRLGNGNYLAKATVIYDEKNVEDTQSFTIGEQSIEISSIDVSNFKLGGIAKFDILLENKWNTKIDNVYAVADVIQNDKIYTSSKTQSVNFGPFEKQFINSYWDTGKVIPGKYNMNINLFYLDKKDNRSFDIYVDYNQIKVMPLGEVIAPEQNGGSKIMNAIYILTILIVILIIFNVYVYFKRLRKKQQ